MSDQRKFFSDKEAKYIDALNREVIQDIASQSVYYYSVIEKYDDDDIYGEDVDKTIAPPIELHARILFPDPEQRINELGIDVVHQIEMYFHSTEVKERGVKIKAGDFVEFANKFWELINVVEKQLVYGDQTVGTFEFKAICNLAREGQFNVPKHSLPTITNQYSGSLDVKAPISTDPLEQWSTPPNEEK